MRHYRSTLTAGILALGVAACGDDVQIVEPTPPVPPLPPAVTASMAPASASVLIGNSVVFAVNASGGVAGDAASWTCASSNSGIATVSGVSAGCQATGVAAGSVTITATVTKSGETVNVGAQLTVTEEATGEPAFLIMKGVTGGPDIVGNPTDASGLKGRVNVNLGVERGDQTLEQLSVLVDGEVVASQSFGSPAMAAPEDDAVAEQAVYDFTLSFDSDGYDVHGGQVDVDYMNGEHTISAELQIAGGMMADGMMGHETITSNVMTVVFDNDDGYMVTADLGDNSALDDQGARWYGGPDNDIVISALAVNFSGAETGAVTVGLTDCDGEAAEGGDDDSAAVGVSFEFDCDGVEGMQAITVSEGGESAMILNEDDLPTANIDMAGPGAPTFNPNPNGREGGWINAAVGITSTSGKEAWLTKGPSDEGVGGYTAQLRYAATPKSSSDLTHEEAALGADPSMALPAENEKADVYCVFASAVDRLGNESALPDEDDAECVTAGMPSVADDPNTADVETEVADGYEALLEAAAAEAATDADADALANAGILAGVDLTAPEVEFLEASLKDEATMIGTNPLWGLHVADRIGTPHSDALDVTIEVRDTEETTKLKEGMAVAPDTFAVTQQTIDGVTRSTVSIQADKNNGRQGYYTFSATAMDAAGNESAEVSRVALHDSGPPGEPGLFLVPEGDGYGSIVVLTDNLSIKSYSTGVVLPDIGSVNAPELIAETGMVDPYNAASLTTSRTVEGMVNMPYKALQVGNGKTLSEVNTFKVYASDQSGAWTCPALTDC